MANLLPFILIETHSTTGAFPKFLQISVKFKTLQIPQLYFTICKCSLCVFKNDVSSLDT